MTELKTPEQWWAEVETQTDNIIELARKVYGETLDAAKVEEFRCTILLRDHVDVHDSLNAIWIDAPDAGYIHTWQGWHNLCDLCSEYTVCFPEGGESIVEEDQ